MTNDGFDISRRDFVRRATAAWLTLHASAWGSAGNAESGGAPGGGSGKGREGKRPAAKLPMRIRELNLRAADPAALVPFYRDKLGLPLEKESDTSVSFRAGETRIAFARAAAGTEPYYHIAFNIPENKIERAIEWAAGRFPLIHFPGVGEPLVHFRAINAHSVYFWDPAGNLLELIARHDMDNASEGAFVSQEILACSEIGLVVDDVQQTVARIADNFGVGVYPAGREPSDVFSMVGDVTGTFIVVRRDRVWLMTEDLPALVFPTEVVLAGTRTKAERLERYPYTIRTG